MVSAAGKIIRDPKMSDVVEKLSADYPQLYLDPDTDTPESYRRVVLSGVEPETKSLTHFRGDVFDRLETIETPAGPVRAVTLGDRRDFELFLRGMMAAKNGPLAPVPKNQGAAILTVFNWPRNRAHLKIFPEKEQPAEFRRFTRDRANYTETLVILSRGPYSNVDAAALGLSKEEWLEYSDTIRRFHELTHVICRRLYPGDVDPVRDEVIADAVGLYAAFGRFDAEKEALFLGIKDGRYTGGRLENYTCDPEKQAARVRIMLERVGKVIALQSAANAFNLIPPLMKAFSP
ncbi:MAG: hypothetical protein IKP22_06040 [Clostridia bacterium]|nr:hypothetical protein [Clostridia bacterium]